jgi:uncharacterized protein
MMEERCFNRHKPVVCYDKPTALAVNPKEIDAQRERAIKNFEHRTFVVPKTSAQAWIMQKGDLCRITVNEGAQVGDLNFWNMENRKHERFYSGKTRQLHASHLKVYDQLWSCLPYLRPMATFVKDSLQQYGIDEDGGALHDVIGTRCDNYTYELMTGQCSTGSCHQYLTEAVKDYGLTEEDVHDVWNIFMCTGFTRVSVDCVITVPVTKTLMFTGYSSIFLQTQSCHER